MLTFNFLNIYLFSGGHVCVESVFFFKPVGSREEIEVTRCSGKRLCTEQSHLPIKVNF